MLLVSRSSLAPFINLALHPKKITDPSTKEFVKGTPKVLPTMTAEISLTSTQTCALAGEYAAAVAVISCATSALQPNSSYLLTCSTMPYSRKRTASEEIKAKAAAAARRKRRRALVRRTHSPKTVVSIRPVDHSLSITSIQIAKFFVGVFPTIRDPPITFHQESVRHPRRNMAMKVPMTKPAKATFNVSW